MKRVSVVIDWISYPKSCCLLPAGFFLETFSIICTIVCSPPPCFSNLFNDPTPNFLLPTDTNILTFVIDGVLSHKTWKFKHLKFLTVFLAKDFSLCTRDEGRRRSITTILYVLLYYDSQPLLSFSAPAKILTQFAPELRSTQTPVADRYSVSVGLLKSHHPAFGKQITKVFRRLLLWILTCVFQIRQNWGQCFLWQALPNVGQEVSTYY